MANIKTLNSKYILKASYPVRGMIDAHACHSSRVTWPLELVYVQTDGELKSLREIAKEKFPPCNLGMFTTEMGSHLVDINTEMYNLNKGVMDNPDKKEIPSLIISTTLDMEFAHFGGYEGEPIRYDDASAFQGWSKQLRDTELAAASNPLRLFPLYSYDPRRYRLFSEKSSGNKSCERWDKPFARIAGSKDSITGIDKIWLGFSMNPSLGFRPFDEFCEHLPRFYKKCADNNIPILARCIPGGITTHEAKLYKGFKQKGRAEKSDERHNLILRAELSMHRDAPLCSDMYQGKERVVRDSDLDHFYRNYGHPRNWIPVLKYFPDLRLCFAGFGGNSVWQHISPPDWASDGETPGREWVACIIKLTRYKNVYADISGLNIYDPLIRSALLHVLEIIHKEYDESKHLKHKLIFGSDWYLTHLMDMNNNKDYSDYCGKFKRLFYEADKSGKLWERVSLINPWNFYALSGDKINKIYDEFVKNSSGKVNCDMLEKMKIVFDGSAETGEGLVNYISRCNEEKSSPESQEPDGGDEDLAAVEGEAGESSNAFGISLAKFTTDNDRAYIRGSPTDSKIRGLEEEPVAGQTRFDCSGWVAYCINKVYRNVFGKELITNSSFYQNIIRGDTDAMIKYADEHGGIRTLKPTYRDKSFHTHRLKRMCNNCELKPQVGDLALWEGHVEIVIEVDGEKFRTSGSSGRASRNDPVPRIKPSWKPFFVGPKDRDLGDWGRGAPGNGIFLGFWTIELPREN